LLIIDTQRFRMSSLWIVCIAIVISIVGHLILFFGIPFFSFRPPLKIDDDLIIKTELRSEPPKKVQLSSAPKKKAPPPKQTNAIASSEPAIESSSKSGGEGGAVGDQQGQPFLLPESSTLYYDAYVDGQLYQTGQLDWIVEGNLYRLFIEIPYAFVGPFVFESRGTVDEYGIAPAIYWTKRGDKPPRYTRFDRDEKGAGKIFFSEKPDHSPDIAPGTQDRFSLMFQLASLLNGSDKIDEAGTVRAIPVVDYTDLDTWQFKSYGETESEDIPSLGLSTNRRYALMQREKDKYKRQVDIWLAKDLDWLPGRFRSLESNGRVLELIFKQKTPITSPH
jgi:hypothetical protein